MKSSQPTEARGDIPRADLQMTSNASGPPFPEGIDRSLDVIERVMAARAGASATRAG